MLGDRKKRILQAIIDDYVSTAEPIGSRTIAKRYDMGLSPATIRNEMADLEELGYLQQPHTSAGRVPSDKGYRLYVDELMTNRNLSGQEMYAIRNTLVNHITAIEQIMKQASGLLSQLTHYTSIAIIPSIKKNAIKYIQIIPIDNNNALMVIVTGAGVVKNTLIKLPETVNNDFIIKFSNILNEKLHGLTIESITFPLIQEIQSEMGTNRDILIPVLDTISQNICNIEDNDVYLEGASNILNYPEYNNIEKAKEFINAVETKDVICRLLEDSGGDLIKISIGSEKPIGQIEDCSIVSTTYSIGDRTIGKIGVIGPKRMDYSKVVTSVDAIRQYLYEVFEDWLFR